MEFQELIRRRRSIRKFSGRSVDRETIRQILEEVAAFAPSSRNSRSTRFLAVDNPDAIARIAAMRDYGSAFAQGAPCVILVLGDRSQSDLWQVNCAISATQLLQTLVDRGLSGCWIQVDGRPRLKAEPDGAKADDYLRSFLPIPEMCGILCAVACGYSDFAPAALPPYDPSQAVDFF